MSVPTIAKDIFLSLLFFSGVFLLSFYSLKSITMGLELLVLGSLSFVALCFKFSVFLFPTGKKIVRSLLNLLISELIFFSLISFIVTILHWINQADNGINFIFFLILIMIEILFLFNYFHRFTVKQFAGHVVNLCLVLALLFSTSILEMGPEFTFQFLFEVTTVILTIITLLSYGSERCIREVRLTIEQIMKEQEKIKNLKVAKFHWFALEIVVLSLVVLGAQYLFSLVLSIRPLEEISAWSFFIVSISLILFVMVLIPGMLQGFFRLILPFFSASRHEREQWMELSLFPHLFCSRYVVRPCQKKRSKTFFYYQGVPCRADEKCQIQLLKGIRTVVGMIAGPDVEDYREEDHYFVNLWQEEHQRARNADIDRFEIRESKRINNYDLAVLSVTKALIDDLSRPRTFLSTIPLTLKGDPPISKGVRKKIEREFATPFLSNHV